MFNQARDITQAHLEDVLALIIGGIIAVPLLIGAAQISYFGYDLTGLEHSVGNTTFSIALVAAVLAGIVSITTNDLRGDVDTVQKAAAAMVVGSPAVYTLVPLVQDVVHYGLFTEVLFVLANIVAYLVLAALPNDDWAF